MSRNQLVESFYSPMSSQREVVESFLHRYARNEDNTYMDGLSPNDIPNEPQGLIEEGCSLGEVPMYVVVLPGVGEKDCYERSAEAWAEFVERKYDACVSRTPKCVEDFKSKIKDTRFKLAQTPEAKLDLRVGIHIVYVDVFAYSYKEFRVAYFDVIATPDVRMADLELSVMLALFPNLLDEAFLREFLWSWSTARLRETK